MHWLNTILLIRTLKSQTVLFLEGKNAIAFTDGNKSFKMVVGWANIKRKKLRTSGQYNWFMHCAM